jgi:transcriptional regulator with XRE-family HTH domain
MPSNPEEINREIRITGRRQPYLANRIREIRESQGVSLSKMAADLGMSKSLLSRLETGDREINDRDKIAIAAYLSESIMQVFFFEGKADGQQN